MTNLFLIAGATSMEHVLSDKSKKRRNVLTQLFDGLKKAYKGKSSEISLYCYSLILRSIAICSQDDTVLLTFFSSFNLEIGEKILNPAKPIALRDDEYFLDEAGMIKLYVHYFQCINSKTANEITASILNSNNSQYKHYLLNAFYILRCHNVPKAFKLG
jgi:hypothetical protein